MKNLFLSLSIFSLSISSYGSINYPKHHASKAQTYVYVCEGKYSKRYHSSAGCKGLENCRGSVVKVTLEQAQKMGRTRCHVCE